MRRGGAPMMKQRSGSIVLMTSIVGMMGNAGQAAYAASKAGLIALCKSLAKELGSRNIRVNAVAPGLIETAMTEKMPDAAREFLIKQAALGRAGEAGGRQRRGGLPLFRRRRIYYRADARR